MRHKAAVLILACAGAFAQVVPRVPTIVTREFGETFVPVNLANGFIGMRIGANPLVALWRLPGARGKMPGTHPVATVVSGFIGDQGPFGNEGIAPAPYPFATDIRVRQTSLEASPEAVRVLEQSLDFSNGELTTRLAFVPSGGPRIDLDVLQFLSRTVPALACQEIRFTPSADSTIEIFTRIERGPIGGTVYLDKAPYEEKQTDLVMGFRQQRNKLGIALVVPRGAAIERRAIGNYVIAAKAGQTYRFRTLAGLVSEAYHPDPHLQAIRVARWGEMLGFDLLREQNRQAWAELWKSRVKVYGDAEAQTALDAAFFYLHSSAHPSSRTGVPPFGFSQFNAYGGHGFWDMDSWMFPPVLLAAPDAARAMLEYRARGLDAARKKAATFGYRGAQYPWEAGIDGDEATPSGADTGWAEHHTAPDVAIAFWEYYLATGDDEFLRESAWPVLKGIAEWIESRGVFTARGFEIRNVMGVDESLANVSNGSHMNLACKMAVQAAVDAARKLGRLAPEKWPEVAQTMVIPVDPERNSVAPYDGATPGPGYSVGMLQFLFPHNPPVGPELLRSTYEFEEALRLKNAPKESNPCSPRAPGFSCPPFAAMAAHFGDRRKAAQLFQDSWKPYWLEPYGASKEYRSYGDGNLITNHGSLLMSVMLGFTGLRITDGEWRKYPASLPEGWRRIEIDRIWVKGKPMRLAAEHGKRAVLEEAH